MNRRDILKGFSVAGLGAISGPALATPDKQLSSDKPPASIPLAADTEHRLPSAAGHPIVPVEGLARYWNIKIDAIAQAAYQLPLDIINRQYAHFMQSRGFQVVECKVTQKADYFGAFVQGLVYLTQRQVDMDHDLSVKIAEKWGLDNESPEFYTSEAGQAAIRSRNEELDRTHRLAPGLPTGMVLRNYYINQRMSHDYWEEETLEKLKAEYSRA